MLFGFAWKTGNKGGTQGNIRAQLAPGANTFDIFFTRRRTFHAFQHLRVRMLKWHIQIGQHFALRHERNNLIDMGVWVNIMQTHPDTQLAQFLDQLGHARFNWPTIDKAGLVFQVNPVSTGVLRNDQQLLDTRLDQVFGLAYYLANIA